MTSITAGVFFHRLAPSARSPHSVRLHILGQQLPSPFGHGVRVQTEEFRNLAISAQLKRLQTSVQTTLLFVEQAREQDNRRPQFVGNIAGRDADG